MQLTIISRYRKLLAAIPLAALLVLGIIHFNTHVAFLLPTGNALSIAPPRNSSWDVVELETKFGPDVVQYTRTRPEAQSDLLWLAITHDKKSWGHNTWRLPRSVDDFLRIVQAQYDFQNTSLGMLTSSRDEFNKYILATAQYPFAKVTIFLHPGFHEGPQIDRSNRHDEEVQDARRAGLAKLRNFLMLKTLREEEHILWVDADVFQFDEGLVRRVLRHTQDRSDVGLITARCVMGEMEDYDLNAWRGTRKGPRGWDLDQKEIKNGELKAQGLQHVGKLIKDTSGDALVELDTIGATILYLRASLIWQGLSFPTQHVIGTRWRKDGWDGMESEGLCYRARGLKGGKCMVMGGQWHVDHTTY